MRESRPSHQVHRLLGDWPLTVSFSLTGHVPHPEQVLVSLSEEDGLSPHMGKGTLPSLFSTASDSDSANSSAKTYIPAKLERLFPVYYLLKSWPA
ncbi:hypothetical protein MES4922_550020 [Mesorhizobium ventifaucium]|uniref:Uncharacterized protein n=1 Tax=Mesorhizobium ventifaucium TaxID=666020 RepID=A0ABN8K936_9HYPH|nr:hypothetical protein MES4922_550020 [Mesorhizobium ventifaucium]